MDGGSAGIDDAGDPPVDAVAPAPDAGPPPVDAGPPPADAGPMCEGDAVLCDGVCVEVETDPSHCGGCGAVCELPHAAVGCAAGECVVAECDEGWGDCDGDAANGCEQDVLFTDTSCGGCGMACGDAELCDEGSCAPTGESCDSPLVLSDGRNVVPWRAIALDHPAAATACEGTAATIAERDIVARYVASADGYVRVSLPDSDAVHEFVFVSSGCGDSGAEMDCSTRGLRTGGGPPAVTFETAAGQEYFIHLYGDGAGPRPMVVDVERIDCSVDSASAYPILPAPGGTSAPLWAKFGVAFDRPVVIAGSANSEVTVSGDRGASERFVEGYPLTPDGRELYIEPDFPHIRYQVGETVDATLEMPALVDAYCGLPVPSISWRFRVMRPSCAPGVDGMLGGAYGLLPSYYPYDDSPVDQLHFAADSDPNGFFFAYADPYRELEVIQKDPGDWWAEGVSARAGFPAFHGDDLFVWTQAGLWRVSRDGGATFIDEHFASLTVPNPIGFPTVYGDEIFIPMAAATGTEVWAFPAVGPAPVLGARVATASGEDACRGVAVDDGSFYLSCGTRRLVRVDRSTGATSLVTDRFEHHASATLAHDLDGDARADVLYGGDARGAFFVCDPASTAPFTEYAAFYDFTTGLPGVVLDPAGSRIWTHGFRFAIELR